MEKVSKILNLVLKIMIVVLIGVTTLLSLTMAYIMFAPDSLPKPFYLSYQYPNTGGAEGGGESVVQVMPTFPPTATLEPGKGYMFSTGTKIINLAEASGKRYIRVSITLEFEPLPASASTPAAGGGEGENTAATSSANSELQTELTAKAPVIDDIIITLISQKTFDTIYTAEGKENLRAEIMNELNRRLPEYHVMSVYFTEFVVE